MWYKQKWTRRTRRKWELSDVSSRTYSDQAFKASCVLVVPFGGVLDIKDKSLEKFRSDHWEVERGGCSRRRVVGMRSDREPSLGMGWPSACVLYAQEIATAKVERIS